MSNTFRVRIVENTGIESELTFGKKGSIINVVNGRFDDLDGFTWLFDSFKDMRDSLLNKCVLKTKIELVEDNIMDCKFKIGDLVKVTDIWETYNAYIDWVDAHSDFINADKFIINGMPTNTNVYKVIYYNTHLDEDSTECIVVIENMNTKQIYLISPEGLTLYESKFLGTKSVESIVFDTDVLRKYQPIKIQGAFNGEDDVIINGIISYVDEHSINIVHCDEDDDETMTTITTNEILNRHYKILDLYE